MARGATQRRGEKRDHSATLDRSTMTGEYPALLRRPARVGAQYQTKVPSSSDFLLRPSPQLMSKEFPYAFVKQDEVAISLSQPANRATVYRNGGSCSTSPRGGVLVHQPSDDLDRFHRFVQPLFRSLLYHQPMPCDTDTWKRRRVDLHNNDPNRKRSRALRKGSKAKQGVQNFDQLTCNLEIMMQEQVTGHKRPRLLTLPEDDALASSVLRQNYAGNVLAAELGVLAALSAGKALKNLRARESEMSNTMKQPYLNSSESWRFVYKNLAISSIFHQFSSAENCSNCFGIRGSFEVAAQIGNGRSPPFTEGYDLKRAWKFMLTSGKAIEQQLSCDAKSTKLRLSTIVAFLSTAYYLPTPESCFGSNHVIIEELSSCLLLLLEHVRSARVVLAKLRDMLHDESGIGIDCASLQKFLYNEGKSATMVLDEVVKYKKLTDCIVKWEQRVNNLLQSWDQELGPSNMLALAEKLVVEAGSHGFKSRTQVELESRMKKAYCLRERIAQWKGSCCQHNKGSVKEVLALVKDTLRLKLSFPEVHDLQVFNRKLESWVERANVAIRSRISLDEIKALIRMGEAMEVDLSDYLDKLRLRVRAADDWLASLNAVVPLKSGVNEERKGQLSWMREIRNAIADGKYALLHELASSGNRIPVEVDTVKLLQVELDAMNWTNKARKWIPNQDGSKKGKLEEIREHVEKGAQLRERLSLHNEEKELWILESEDQLISIVSAADCWLNKYEPYLGGDNRRNEIRVCVSIQQLRTIVQEGDSIYANMGNATAKISRILFQAETWYEKHEWLLFRCGLRLNDKSDANSNEAVVTIDELTKAVKSAASDVPIDLDDAVALEKVLDRTLAWSEKVESLAPKRNKRINKSTGPTFVLQDLVNLIEEATELPTDTSNEQERLNLQINRIKSWEIEASNLISSIAIGFDHWREDINIVYGAPSVFQVCLEVPQEESREAIKLSPISEVATAEDWVVDMRPNKFETEIDHEDMTTIKNASKISENQAKPEAIMEKNPVFGGKDSLVDAIFELQRGAPQHGVITAAGDIAKILQSVSRWCLRSLKYLSTPREVLDKRFFGAFDRFVREGEELLERSRVSECNAPQCLCVHSSWCAVINDQLVRLQILRKERTKFSVWCKAANEAITAEKRFNIEQIQELAVQSKNFPAVNDLIPKLQALSEDVTNWTEKVRNCLESDQKMSMPIAKSLIEDGDKLRMYTNEYKTLHAALRAARVWATKVRRCNLDLGSVSDSGVDELVAAHGSLLVEMPEEILLLQQATQKYCLCQKHYEGFMIGCDECEEWYHGPCIGVSESRADRVGKFVCVRCSVKNIFKSSCDGAIGIIRKWTSSRDLKRARQVDYQKHQRKIRKEKKDIEQLKREVQALETLAQNLTECGDVTSSVSGVAVHGTGEMLASNRKAVSSLECESNGDKRCYLELEEGNNSQNTVCSASGDLREKCEDPAVNLIALKEKQNQAQMRMEHLIIELNKRKQTDTMENDVQNSLRRWCIRVRSLVLIPSNSVQSEMARPAPSGELSGPMLSVLSDALALGISTLSDVEVMENYFRCISWSLHTLSVLRRKPALPELRRVLSMAEGMRLPDEKATRTLKFIVQKSLQLRTKIKKTLAPKPGLGKPIALDTLRELIASVNEFTVSLPEGRVLRHIVRDKGTRHCFCQWPSFGTTMITCDHCKVRFHAQCVGMSKEDASTTSMWFCDACSGGNTFRLQKSVPLDYCQNVPLEESAESSFSKHAPDPALLWPPFSLLGSAEAVAALNAECCNIPDDTESIDIPSTEGEALENHDLNGSMPNTFNAQSTKSSDDPALHEK